MSRGYKILVALSLIQIAICTYMLATAGANDVVELKEVSVDYSRFIYARLPLFYASTPKENIDFKINTAILKYGFADLTLHSQTDEHQFHVAGLRARLGVRVSKLEVYYKHESTHILDQGYPYSRYPVEDSVGVKFYLYRGKNNE
jgi:hypothetical protein